MTSQQVLQGVTQALSEVLGVDESQIQPTTTLLGELQATSLDVVDLLFQLRKKFGIELTLAEVQRELSADTQNATNGDGPAQGFNDALFESVTVQNLANWVTSRLPAT
jgi:acyl carrier protein